MEHLSREQLREVLRCARAARRRDWILLLVTFWHGLRASEAIALTLENFRDGFLTVQRLKGSLRTTQPLVEDPDELLNERAAVAELLAQAQPREKLFPVTRFQLYRRFRRYCAQAGLPSHLAHPHVLKHSIAMQTIRDAGIENVRQYLGHRSISSTGEYLKVTDDAASSAIAAAAARKPLNS